MSSFVVHGGIFTDTDFLHLESDEELYGPYPTYERALVEWNRSTRRNLDICCHRVFIEKVGVNDA